MPESLTLTVRNELAEVGRINEALSEYWQQHALPEDLEGQVSLALEEVLSNVIRHGCEPGGAYDIRVRFAILPGAFEFEISDNGKEFNPLTLPAPNIHAPLEERRAGGLGVFLVQKIADRVCYEQRDGFNHFLFSKNLPAA